MKRGPTPRLLRRSSATAAFLLPSRKYLSRLLAMTVLCTLLSCTVCSAEEVGSDGLRLNGMAPVYAQIRNPINVQATLLLPNVPTNSSWYSNWIMIVDRPTPNSHASFIQIGLIRNVQRHGLQAFVSYQGRDDLQISYKTVASNVSEGAHTFRIRQVERNVVFSMDGRIVNYLTFAVRRNAYLQAGPEVFAEGDRASGVLSAIETEQRLVLPTSPSICRYENHGISLMPSGDKFIAFGIFNRAKRSGFLGNCSGF